MKKFTFLIYPLLLIGVFIVASSCEKENQPPTCEIIFPNFGDEFIQGNIVTISVDANDPDGTIKEISFYIDDVYKSSSNNFPYEYDWDTKDVNEGSHIIKAVAIDDGNLQTENNVEVVIQPNNGEFTDSRDDNTYKWVKIGDQVWMAENLAYDAGDGCWERGGYDMINETTIITYGRFYTWEVALEVCPSGWHLPGNDEWEQLAQYVRDQKRLFSDDEWEQLEQYISNDEWKQLEQYICDQKGLFCNGPFSVNELAQFISDQKELYKKTDITSTANKKYGTTWHNVGKHLKTTGTMEDRDGAWHKYDPGDEGTDDFGFSGLPAGMRFPVGYFDGFRCSGKWWSSTESSVTNAWSWGLSNSSTSMSQFSGYSKDYGFSVRCVKD